MSLVRILKGGVELSNESGVVPFSTDWQEIRQPAGLGKALTLSAQFPNTLTGGGIQNMALEVSNDGVNPQDKKVVEINDSISEDVTFKFFRFDFRHVGGAPTGVVSSILTELI